MAYTDIDKPSDYFNTKLYTGTGSTLNITGVGFQPDLVWTKGRDSTAEGVMDHALVDSVRGVTKTLRSNTTGAEGTETNSLTAFGSDGYTVGANGKFNYSSSDIYVSWNWKAGTSFTNDASSTGIGTIDSAGSASDASGFSIVSYTGTGSNGTIKHGLSTAPKMVIVKSLGESEAWNNYNANLTSPAYVVQLSTTGAQFSNGSTWNSTAPTSSVFSVGTDAGTNKNSINFIAYCFADVQGFSKMGSYIGNGSADGSFIYTGQKSAFIMIKRIDTAADWEIYDNKRLGFNDDNAPLYANATTAEGGNGRVDILSNGFKIRAQSGNLGATGGTYIYMAFAENPFVTSTGVPATAR